MSAARLYTPEVLALATRLSDYPWDDALALRASARSRSCGSTLELCASLDSDGRLERLGLRAHACAVGQASAAVFCGAALGRRIEDLQRCEGAVSAWLAGSADMPDWPGLAAIAPARAYPARHGAIMLAWTAASALLSSRDAAR